MRQSLALWRFEDQGSSVTTTTDSASLFFFLSLACFVFFFFKSCLNLLAVFTLCGRRRRNISADPLDHND